MTRDEAIAALVRHAPAIRARGIAAAYVFGSTVRDTAHDGSDIDLFIDPELGRRFSLIDLIALRDYLQDELRRPVDVTTRNGLHPLLKSDIEREAIRVL